MTASIEAGVRPAAAVPARLPSAAMPHLPLAASRQTISTSRALPLIPGLSPLLLLLPPFCEPGSASAVPRTRGSVAEIATLLLAAAPARAAVHVVILSVIVILLCPFSALLPPRLRRTPRYPALPKVRHGAG